MIAYYCKSKSHFYRKCKFIESKGFNKGVTIVYDDCHKEVCYGHYDDSERLSDEVKIVLDINY